MKLEPILFSQKRDLFLLILPGHLAMLLLLFATKLDFSFMLTVIIFFTMIIVDTGHVYTTFIRLFKEKLLGEDKRKIYKFVVIYSALSVGILSFDGALFWKIALYATFFHYIKQNIGFLKIYDAIAGIGRKESSIFLYLFQLVGIISIHFLPDAKLNYYSANDLFGFPSDELFSLVRFFYLFVFILWGLFCISNLSKKSISFSSAFFVTSHACLFAYPFLFNYSLEFLLLPIIISHGVPYFFLISKSVRLKMSDKYRAGSLMLVLIVALLLGMGEDLFESNLVSYIGKDYSFAEILLNTLFLFPLFLHFFIDSFLWKRNSYNRKNIIFSSYD